MSKNELVTRAAVPAVVPDRATRVASWIGWHLFEITGVTAPAVFAVSGTSWAWLVSGVVGAGWTVHTVRTVRQQSAVTAGQTAGLPSQAAGVASADESPTTYPKGDGTTGGTRAGGAL